VSADVDPAKVIHDLGDHVGDLFRIRDVADVGATRKTDALAFVGHDALSSSRMSTMATFAPSDAKRNALARPIPCPAPVTTAVLPANLLT
jgi:hypothetical protein